MELYNESKLRTVIKTASYRFWTSTFTLVAILYGGGSIELGLMVVAMELLIKPLFYFFHERAWNKIKFGKKCLLGYDDFDDEEIT